MQDRRALERVLELQLGATVGQLVQLTTQAAIGFLSRLLGRRDWSAALLAAGDEGGGPDAVDAHEMVTMIESLTGEDARCSNSVRYGSRCFMWFSYDAYVLLRLLFFCQVEFFNAQSTLDCHDCTMNGAQGLCYHCATVCHQRHSS